MDSSQPAPSILDTLRTVEFRLGLKGYNVDEVDEYLEKAAVEAEAMQESTRQVNERLRQATERIAQLEGSRRDAPVDSELPHDVTADDSLQRTLLLAQKFVDQARRESEAEAGEVVAQAEERAQSTIAQAEEHARRITQEAQQSLREEVARLETSRGQLAGDVENMANHLESERQRLQKALTEVLKWIEDNVQPANALMALRPRSSTEGARTSGSSRGADDAPMPSSDLGADTGRRPDDTVAHVLDLRGSSSHDGPASEGPSANRT